VNNLEPKDRDVAMVFQNYALYPHMTVRDNIGFALKMRKMPAGEIAKRSEDAAKILGIEHLLQRRPKELSGGQRQRVAVARAIVRNPAVFLFDEPLSNLDAKLRVQMRAEISKLQDRLKTTAVYVTHDQVEAMTMGHRLAVMNQGKIQQLGTPIEVYDRPATVFVAQFIGTPPMNLFDVVVEDGSLKANGFSLPLPAGVAATPGQKLHAGIRPEHLLGGGRRPRGAGAPLKGVVEIVEPLGYEAIVYARVGDELFVSPFETHAMPKAGEQVELLVEVDKLHLFDAESGKRL
jgi:multiple sugar transport system ATP-binding protein